VRPVVLIHERPLPPGTLSTMSTVCFYGRNFSRSDGQRLMLRSRHHVSSGVPSPRLWVVVHVYIYKLYKATCCLLQLSFCRCILDRCCRTPKRRNPRDLNPGYWGHTSGTVKATFSRHRYWYAMSRAVYAGCSTGSGSRWRAVLRQSPLV